MSEKKKETKEKAPSGKAEKSIVAKSKDKTDKKTKAPAKEPEKAPLAKSKAEKANAPVAPPKAKAKAEEKKPSKTASKEAKAPAVKAEKAPKATGKSEKPPVKVTKAPKMVTKAERPANKADNKAKVADKKAKAVGKAADKAEKASQAADKAAAKQVAKSEKPAVKGGTKSPHKAPPKVAPKAPAPVLPKSQFGVTLSLPPASMELPVPRSAFKLRARGWMKDLEKEGHLKPDSELFIPKELYFSTGLGDFNKVATWAQWYGVQLISDLANIDRQRFALIAIEQVTDVTTFFYGLLQRETGQIRHQFNLVVEEMPDKMAAQGIELPSWFDVKDLDHYRLG